MLCPFYRYIDKRAAYALPPEILTYGDIFYISVPVPIFSQFNFSDAFIVLVVKIYYLISIVNIFKAICLLILFILFVLLGQNYPYLLSRLMKWLSFLSDIYLRQQYMP